MLAALETVILKLYLNFAHKFQYWQHALYFPLQFAIMQAALPVQLLESVVLKSFADTCNLGFSQRISLMPAEYRDLIDVLFQRNITINQVSRGIIKSCTLYFIIHNLLSFIIYILIS